MAVFSTGSSIASTTPALTQPFHCEGPTDCLEMADFHNDSFPDLVSVHEDSDHLRLSLGSDYAYTWISVTLDYGERRP